MFLQIRLHLSIMDFRLIDLEISLMNGIFEYNEDYGDGTPVIWVDDLYYDTPIKLDGLRKVRVDGNSIKKYQVLAGDLLFTRSSLVREGIGQINIVPELKQSTLFECHTIRARLNKKINPYYVLGLYRSDFGKRELFRRAKTSTMTTIGQEDLSDLPCPLSNIEAQKKYEEIFREHVRVEWKLAESSRQAEHLFQSLLQRAFRGEL